MTAIDILMEEHQLIIQTIGALEAYTEAIIRNESIDQSDLGRFVQFIREFADRHHHGKEEDVLFKTMIDNGFPKEQGPLAVMLHEHDVGRGFVETLAEKSSIERSWSEEDRSQIVESARGFGALLRSHILKEDQILYPMARNALPPDVMTVVDQTCAEIDARSDGSGERENFRTLANQLAEKFTG
jgi:hemerythrin-like domain-containing protein